MHSKRSDLLAVLADLFTYIFRRLLLRLATECKLTFVNSFYKHIDGSSLAGPVSVTFSETYIVQIE